MTQHHNANTWKFSVTDLIGQPGESRVTETEVTAPDDLGTPVLAVIPGSEIFVDLRFDSVHEGILVSGEIEADLAGECSRCLDPIEEELNTSINELYLYQPDPDVEDDEDQHLVLDDTVDIEPIMRNAVVSSIPFQPRCKPDCQGLCDQCGIRLEVAEPGHSHETIDPRWAALETLASSHNDEKTSDNDTEER